MAYQASEVRGRYKELLTWTTASGESRLESPLRPRLGA